MAGEEVQLCGTGRGDLLFVVFRYKARGYMGGVVVLDVCDAGGFVNCYRLMACDVTGQTSQTRIRAVLATEQRHVSATSTAQHHRDATMRRQLKTGIHILHGIFHILSSSTKKYTTQPRYATPSFVAPCTFIRRQPTQTCPSCSGGSPRTAQMLALPSYTRIREPYLFRDRLLAFTRHLELHVAKRTLDV